MLGIEPDQAKSQTYEKICIKVSPDMHKSIDELRIQWGMSSKSEAVESLLGLVLSSETPEPDQKNNESNNESIGKGNLLFSLCMLVIPIA